MSSAPTSPPPAPASRPTAPESRLSAAEPRPSAVESRPSAPSSRPLPVGWLSATAICATAAPAWLLASAFYGPAAKAALFALAIGGVILAALAARSRFSALFIFAAPLLPFGVVVAAAAGQAPHGASAAVWEAVRSGQLANPPVMFTPGWQILTAALLLALAAASVYISQVLDSVRAAALVTLPVVLALVLIQSPGRQLSATLPALLLVLLALACAQRGERVRDGAAGPMGVRELLSVAVALTVVGGLIAAAVHFGLLGSVRSEDAGQPARLPAASKLTKSKAPLFTLRSPQAVPLRVGVLDHYDGKNWWTPQVPEDLPELGGGKVASAKLPVRTVSTAFVSVESADIGRFAPLVPGTIEVSGLPADSTLLPGHSALRLPVAAEPSLGYTVRFARPDLGILKRTEFAPAAEKSKPGPVAAARLKDAAEKAAQQAAEKAGQHEGERDAAAKDAAGAYERIDRVRSTLFSSAKQQGQGQPVAITPARVDEIFQGAPATGFEIAAADALLVRWSGVEARIAYGYLNRQPNPDGSFTLTNDNGASWVEIKAADGSWFALTDRPAGETAPTASAVERLVPNGERIATMFVPVQRPNPAGLTSAVMWWVQAYVIAALSVLTLIMLVPAILRAVRARRRRRWAAAHGPREQIAVAYAALRDTAIDLNVGTAEMTPLEFLDAVEPDRDHRELAWLVERALWGDLSRDLTAADAEAATRLVTSLRRRLVQGQTYAQRILGFASHASLRHPWSEELPNAYKRRWVRVEHISQRRPWLIRGLIAAAACLLLLLPFAVGIDRPDLRSDPAAAAQLPKVPERVGDVRLQPASAGTGEFDQRRRQSLLDATAMYTVTPSSVAEGTLQVGVLKKGLAGQNLAIRSGILDQLGMTEVVRVGPYLIYSRRLGDLTVSLSFAPDGQSFRLLTTTSAFDKPLQFLARVSAAAEGRAGSLDLAEPIVPPDVRQDRDPIDIPEDYSDDVSPDMGGDMGGSAGDGGGAGEPGGPGAGGQAPGASDGQGAGGQDPGASDGQGAGPGAGGQPPGDAGPGSGDSAGEDTNR